MFVQLRRSKTPPSFTRRTALMALVGFGAAYVWPSSGRVLAAETAPDFRVIVHPDAGARSLDRAQLAKLFLKEVSRWDDGEIAHPVDLRADSKTRARFSEAVLKRSTAAVRSYWQQRIFSGRGVPPPEMETDADVVRYVFGHRGAVGYVSGGADIGRVRALEVKD